MKRVTAQQWNSTKKRTAAAQANKFFSDAAAQTKGIGSLLSEADGKAETLNSLISKRGEVNSLLEKAEYARNYYKSSGNKDMVKSVDNVKSYLTNINKAIESSTSVKGISENEAYQPLKGSTQEKVKDVLEPGWKMPGTVNYEKNQNEINNRMYDFKMFSRYGKKTLDELTEKENENFQNMDNGNRAALVKENNWIESYKQQIGTDDDFKKMLDSAKQRQGILKTELDKRKSETIAFCNSLDHGIEGNGTLEQHKAKEDEISKEIEINEALVNRYEDYVKYGKSNMDKWASEVKGKSYEDMQKYIASMNENNFSKQYEDNIKQYEGGEEYLDWAKNTGRDISTEDFNKYLGINNYNELDDKDAGKLDEIKSNADNFEKNSERGLKTEYLKKYADSEIDTYSDYQAKYNEMEKKFEEKGNLDGYVIQEEWQDKYADGYLKTKQEYNFKSLPEDEQEEILKQTEDDIYKKGDITKEYDRDYLKNKRNELIERGFSSAEADSILGYASAKINSQIAARENAKMEEYGKEHKVLGTIRSVAHSLDSGDGYASAFWNRIKNSFGGETPFDYNSPEMRNSQYAQSLRKGVSDNIDSELGKSAYNAIASALDSMAIAPLASVAPWAPAIILGSSAATSSMIEGHDKGLNDAHAIGQGLAAGIFETFFEKYSIDKIVDMSGGSKNIKNCLMNVVKSMGIEGSEEGFTEIANIAYDSLANGGLSDYNIAVKNYTEQGYSKSEAEAKARTGLIKRVAENVGGGMIGGAIFGGTFGAAGYAKNAPSRKMAKYGNKIIESGTYSELESFVKKNYSKDTDIYQQMLNTNINDAAEVGYLATSAAVKEERTARTEYSKVLTDAAKGRLEELGVDEKNSASIAQKIATNAILPKRLNKTVENTEYKDAINQVESELKRNASGEDVEWLNNADWSANMRHLENASTLSKLTAGESLIKKMNESKQEEIKAKINQKQEQGYVTEGKAHLRDDVNTTFDVTTLIVKNGKTAAAVRTPEGNTEIYDMDRVAADTSVIALYEFGEDYAPEQRASFFRAYDESRGMAEPLQFATAYESAYKYGAENEGIKSALGNNSINLVLSDSQIELAYNAGKQEYQSTAVKKQREQLIKARSENKGTVKFDKVDSKKLNKVQKSAVDVAKALTSAAGVNITFFESEKNAEGKYAEANGQYDWDSNSIRIDINAGLNSDYEGHNIMTVTLAHELTHYIERFSPENYGQIEEFIFNKLREESGKDAEELIRTEIKLLKEEDIKQNKTKKTEKQYRSIAKSEIIARGCELMLTDKNTIVELARKNRGIFGKLKAKIEQFVKSVDDACSDMIDNEGDFKAGTVSKEALLLRKYSKELLELWNDALMDAEEMYKGSDKSNQNGEILKQIRYDENNTPFVEIEEDILEGVPKKDWNRRVKEVLKERFKDGVQVGNNMFFTNKHTRKEFLRNGYTTYLMHNDPVLYTDKLKMSNNADEIITASQNYINEEKKHDNKDIVDFSRGNVLISIGEKDYKADVVVGLHNNGNLYLYDITNINTTKIKRRTISAGRFSESSNRSDSSSNNIISNKSENDNNKLNQNRHTEGRELTQQSEEIKQIPGDEDIRYQTRDNYEKQVDDVLKNKKYETTHVYMGETPVSLLDIGLKELPMLVTNSHIYSMAKSEAQARSEGRYRSRYHYHEMGKNLILKLPEAMKNPVMIIKSNTNKFNADIVLVTDLKDNQNKNIIVAIKPSGLGNYNNIEIETNLMKSAYGKDNINNLIKKAYAEKRIIAIDNFKSQKMLNPPSVQFANNILTSDFTNNLSQYKKIVNNIIRNDNVKDASEDKKSLDQNRETSDTLLEGQQLKAKISNRSMSSAEDEDIRYQLRKNYKEDIGKWFNSTSREQRLKDNGRFLIGTTSDALKSINVKDMKVYFGKAKMQKILNKHNDMTIDLIKEVPEMLERPVVVMDSVTRSDSLVILGELYTKKGIPVMATLLIDPKNKNGQVADFEVISSAYAKEDIKRYQNLLNNSVIRYIGPDKNRTDSWLSKLRLQLPSQITNYGSINKITAEDGFVNFELNQKRNITPRTYEEALKQNKEYQHVIENLRKQFQLTKGHKVGERGINRLAAKMVKETRTQLTREELRESIEEVFNRATEDNLEADEVIELLKHVAYKALNEKRQDTKRTDYAQNILDELKKSRIRLSRFQQSEIEHYTGSKYNDWRKSMMGKVIIANEGIPLDMKWSELSAVHPELFKEDISPADQPIKLSEIIYDLQNDYANDYGFDFEDAASYCATEVLAEYSRLPEVKTYADRQKEKFERWQQEYENKIGGIRKEYARKSREYRTKIHRETAESVREWKKQQLEREKNTREKYEARLRQRIYNIKNSEESMRATRDKEKTRNQIIRTVRSIKTQLLKPTAQRHIPQGFRTVAAQTVQEFLNDTSVFSYDQLDELEIAYGAIESEDSDLYSLQGSYDVDVKALLSSLKNNIAGKRLSMLNWVELEQVNDVVNHINTIIKNETEIEVNGKQQVIDKIGNDALEDLDSQGIYKELHLKGTDNNGKPNPYRNMLYNNLTPVYYFKQMGGTFSELYKDIMGGQDKWAKNVARSRDVISDIKKKHGYDSWDFKKTMELGDGIKLNAEQAMYLYATAKRENENILKDTQHLSNGGVILEDNIVYDEKGILKWTGTQKMAYHVRGFDLARVRNFLTAEQIGYVDDIVKYLSYDMAELGNETSMQLCGIKKYVENYYFPYKTAGNYIKRSATEHADIKSSLKNTSFSHELTKKAATPVVLGNFTETAGEHIEGMCLYNAMAIPQDNLNRVLNYQDKIKDEQGNVIETRASVKQVLESCKGKKAVQYMDYFLKGLNGGIKADPMEGAINRMTRKMKKGAVYASLSVAIQQPSAICRAMALVDGKYFAKTAGTKRDWEECKKYNGVAVIKEMGGFDTGTGKGAVDYMVNKTPESKVGQAVQFADEKVLGRFPAKMDELTWCHIWNAVKAETKEKGSFNGEEEFFKAASERFNEVINKTQVYDSFLAKSMNMNSKASGIKMATAFMTEPTLTYNLLVDAVKNFKADKKYCVRAISSIVVQTVVNAALKALIQAMRNNGEDDEDKSYFEKYVKAFSGNIAGLYGIAGDLNPLTWIPFVKDVISLIEGYDVERADISLLSDLVDSVNTTMKVIQGKGSKTPENAVESLASSIAACFGIPVKNVLRDIHGVANLFGDIVNKNMLPSGRDSVVKAFMEGIGVETTTEDLIYDCIEKGDKTILEQMVIDSAEDIKIKYPAYSKEKVMKQARSGVRSKFTRVLKESYLSGETDKEETVKRMQATGLYVDEKNKDSSKDILVDWDITEFKRQYLETSDFNERKELRKKLHATKHWKSLSALDKQLKKWREE